MEGSRIVVEDGARRWQPESGQILFDFGVADLAQEGGPDRAAGLPRGAGRGDRVLGRRLVRVGLRARAGLARGGHRRVPPRPRARSRAPRRPREPRAAPARGGRRGRGRAALRGGAGRAARRRHGGLQPRRRARGHGAAAGGAARLPAGGPHRSRRTPTPTTTRRRSPSGWGAPPRPCATCGPIGN